MIDEKFLNDIGITDKDTVSKITAAYTSDIKTEQGKTEALQKSFDEANTTIQSYKDMDIDGIKASVEDYKTKYEQAEADRKDFEYKTKLQGYVKSLCLRDDVYEQHVTSLLAEKGLQFDGDKLIGGDDIVNTFKESHADAFRTNETPKPFNGSAQGTAAEQSDDIVKKIMGLA